MYSKDKRMIKANKTQLQAEKLCNFLLRSGIFRQEKPAPGKNQFKTVEFKVIQRHAINLCSHFQKKENRAQFILLPEMIMVIRHSPPHKVIAGDRNNSNIPQTTGPEARTFHHQTFFCADQFFVKAPTACRSNKPYHELFQRKRFSN